MLVSGGLDSATVLAIARERGHRCHALSFDYGQRHRAELDAAHRVATAQGAVEHRVLALPIGGFGHSALTDPAIPVPEQPTAGIPTTYVPARRLNDIVSNHSILLIPLPASFSRPRKFR